MKLKVLMILALALGLAGCETLYNLLPDFVAPSTIEKVKRPAIKAATRACKLSPADRVLARQIVSDVLSEVPAPEGPVVWGGITCASDPEEGFRGEPL